MVNEHELIGKISNGSKMDQIYISKNRVGFNAGEYVRILPLKGNPDEEVKSRQRKLNFYGIKELEPVKISIIGTIINIISEKISYDNIIFTGSFLEKGFDFNDIDILLISEEKINPKNQKIEAKIIKESIENMTGINTHIIFLDNKTLASGLSADPLYNLMISRCVSLNKLIFNIKRKIYYKILDLNLLKSKNLINNFNILNGDEKYYLTLNMISILLFIQDKKLSKDIVNAEIERQFNIKIKELKENLVEKSFTKKYEEIFNKTFSLILDSIKSKENGKQKQAS